MKAYSPRIGFALLSGLFMSSGIICSVQAADGPPGTDIYLADLAKSANGMWQAKNIVQLTKRRGYDNQPYFLPDGSGLLYTAMLAAGEGMWQSDSFEYRFADKKHYNLTNTPLSEYSPTLMNNGQYFSTIVERENQQQFWAQPYHNGKKAYRLNQSEPVGYHVWGKNDDLVMFILGKKNTLQYQKNLKTSAKIVAQDIGRSLRYNKNRNAFSFTQLRRDKQWWLSEYLPKSDEVTPLVPLPKGAGYYTWLDSHTAITAVDGVVHQWAYKHSDKANALEWLPWLDVSSHCKTKVSRIAVNAQHNKLAFVCDEK